jgi:hypothetical protein
VSTSGLAALAIVLAAYRFAVKKGLLALEIRVAGSTPANNAAHETN